MDKDEKSFKGSFFLFSTLVATETTCAVSHNFERVHYKGHIELGSAIQEQMKLNAFFSSILSSCGQ